MRTDETIVPLYKINVGIAEITKLERMCRVDVNDGRNIDPALDALRYLNAETVDTGQGVLRPCSRRHLAAAKS